MKTLTNYINESIVILEQNIWSLPIKDKAEMVKILDETVGKLENDRIYSLDNQTDCKKIYNIFKDKCERLGTKTMIADKLASLGIKDPQSFRRFILSNHDQFEKYHFKIGWVLQWNETEAEKKYKEWKNSKDYVEAIDDDSAEERDLVIYDRWNPETHEVYPFKGKRGKNTDHQVNMLRIQFHYDTDVKYYDCYPILAKNYYGHEDDLKKRAESQLGYDDPNEFSE